MHLSKFDFLNNTNCSFNIPYLKVVTSEKIGGSGPGVISTLGTWYGGVVMGVLLTFNEAAILYRDFNCAPSQRSQKQNIIVFAANNSRCCECHYVAMKFFYNESLAAGSHNQLPAPLGRNLADA